MSDLPDEHPDPVPSPAPGPRRIPRWAWVGVACLGAGLAGGMIDRVERMREATARVYCNLGSLSVAFHNYQEAHGRLPPAVVYGYDGKPLLSWRVLILPYIEQEALYKEFKLDEPWDSEHNKKLLARMPRLYAPPWTKYVKVPPHHTVLHVLVGPGTPFERDGLRIPDDFPDGPSNTVLFVEAGDPVPWTKPEEIPFDPAQPVRLRGLFKTGFRACTADGTYRFITSDTDEATLRAAVTRNGGEPPGW
jgi:hypothetical protein